MSTKNQEAENKAVRQKLWGNDGSVEDEDMGHTILGDVTHPTPIVIAGQQSSGFGKVLAGAALGVSLLGIPAAGVAGYMMSQLGKSPSVSVQPATPQDDQTVDLGLLHIEDLRQ